MPALLAEPDVAHAPLNTAYGNFELYCFSWSTHEEDNVLALANKPEQAGCLVRIQSACYTGEIFKSHDCDCHEQLDSSLRKIADEGGLFIYMLRDGRGAGLLTKVRALGLLSERGLDTAEAYDALGVKRDPREYDQASSVLQHFGIRSLRLLTNNPRKVAGIKAAGIAVRRLPLEIPATAESAPYLRTKAEKMGHILKQFGGQ